jgi:hypothetical protein
LGHLGSNLSKITFPKQDFKNLTSRELISSTLFPAEMNLRNNKIACRLSQLPITCQRTIEARDKTYYYAKPPESFPQDQNFQL